MSELHTVSGWHLLGDAAAIAVLLIAFAAMLAYVVRTAARPGRLVELPVDPAARRRRLFLGYLSYGDAYGWHLRRALLDDGEAVVTGDFDQLVCDLLNERRVAILNPDDRGLSPMSMQLTLSEAGWDELHPRRQAGLVPPAAQLAISSNTAPGEQHDLREHDVQPAV